MTEPTLKPHWKDLGQMRTKYHGKCTFDVFVDGCCYECMFYIDDDCGYLVRDTETNK